MGAYTGGFFGYREKPPSPKLRMYGWKFTPPDPEIRLKYSSWDLLGPTPFRYDVYGGLAGNDYQTDFVRFPFVSRLLLITVRDAPGELIFTFDGIDEQPQRQFDLGFITLEAAAGFKVRNAEVGNICRYQVIPMQ